METNYRIAYDKYWQDLKRKDPEEVANYLAVTYERNDNHFVVMFFGSEYILDCNSEKIYRKRDEHPLNITAGIIILNYLAYAGPIPKTTPKWVSLKELPNGGMLFYPAFLQSSLKPLIKAFGRESQKLIPASAELGGIPADFGDASVVFQAFPEIPLGVIVWEGDEEVRANATILYDPSIEYLLHIESAIGLGMYLSNQLVKRAAGLSGR